jgi:hypothetical protein
MANNNPEDKISDLQLGEPHDDDQVFLMMKGKSVVKVEDKRNLLIAFSKKVPSDLFNFAFSRLAEVASLYDFFKAAKRSSMNNWNATLCAKKLLQIHAMVDSMVSKELESYKISMYLTKTNDPPLHAPIVTIQ